MALQSSGQISLNEIHVEAAQFPGVAGTQATINDTDIRGLISASSEQSNLRFSDFYGAQGGTFFAPVQLTSTISGGITSGGTRQYNYNQISDTVSLPSMPSNGTGKRLFVMVAGMRDWNGSIRLNRYNQFNNMKVGSTTLTEVTEGHSDYNSSAIGVGFGNDTGTVTLEYNINVNIGGGAGYTYLFVLDYVNEYIFTEYHYDYRYGISSVMPNKTVTYDSSYANKKELLLFCGNTSNSSSNWNWYPSNNRTYTRLGGFDNGTTEWHTCYYHFGDYGPDDVYHRISGNYNGARAPNGAGAAGMLMGLK